MVLSKDASGNHIHEGEWDYVFKQET